MKKVIDKVKLVNNSLSKHLILNNKNIFDQKTIANSFNEYFVNVGSKLAREIPGSDSSFEEVTLSDTDKKKKHFSP